MVTTKGRSTKDLFHRNDGQSVVEMVHFSKEPDHFTSDD